LIIVVSTASRSTARADLNGGAPLAQAGAGVRYVRDGAEIYRQSFATIRAEAALDRFPAGLARVVVRMIHACGMTDLPKDVEVLSGMAREAGFKLTNQPVDFNTEWPKIRDGRGNFEGIAWQNWGVSGTDPGERLWKEVSSGASNLLFTGFDPNGKGDHKGDPTVDDLIRKGRIERDNNKRKQLLFDLQKYMADQMYIVRALSGATGFDLAWPALLRKLDRVDPSYRN